MAYYGLSAMVVTKKQHKFGHATEELVVSPKINDNTALAP
jgi:hypothetical protein